MELDFGPAVEKFREELRAWIASEDTQELVELADWRVFRYGGSHVTEHHYELESHPAFQRWEKALLSRRLMCPGFPYEYGGQDMDPVRIAVLNDEIYRAGLPRIRRTGEGLVGPVLLAYGTAEQKKRFLPPIVTNEHRYCQGFSEPDHGSDLAGLETRGVVDGDELVISGQKIWTTLGAKSNHMFMLVRTDRDAPKHAGLTWLIIDFKAPGVDFRPIRQMSGSAEFGTVFFDDVRAPLANVVGGLNNGWKVTTTTLGHERTGFIEPALHEHEFEQLLETARQYGQDKDPGIRQRLAKVYTNVQMLRYLHMRLLASLAAGLPIGPEVSLAKVAWSEHIKFMGELLMDIEGAQALIRPEGAPGEYEVDYWQDLFLISRAASIYAGTNEIQRNIISERVLGLPREPNVEERAR